MNADDESRSTMMRVLLAATAAQLAMVVAGHYVLAIAALFGIVGMLISLLAGAWYGAKVRLDTGRAALGGAVVGGICAFIGIVVSFALGDVTPLIIVFGTLSSAVAGAIGGVIGRALTRRRTAPNAGT